MKFKERRFSIPFAIFDEQMPSKAFKLLVYLFGEADFAGHCRPGYEAMRLAIRDESGENGSPATVRRYLHYLEKRAWIFHMKKTNGRMAIYIQIPPRFKAKSKDKKEAVPMLSVVSA